MLSHVDGEGRPKMVDVSGKDITRRIATACSTVELPAEVAETLRTQGFNTAKGPVFHTAIVAGTLAAKRTHELIPFCHPLGLENCSIDIACDASGRVQIQCTVSVHGRTGVEMEALTGASVAALTVYDMCKALSHHIVISGTRLLHKSGGKSEFRAAGEP